MLDGSSPWGNGRFACGVSSDRSLVSRTLAGRGQERSLGAACRKAAKTECGPPPEARRTSPKGYVADTRRDLARVGTRLTGDLRRSANPSRSGPPRHIRMPLSPVDRATAMAPEALRQHVIQLGVSEKEFLVRLERLLGRLVRLAIGAGSPLVDLL